MFLPLTCQLYIISYTLSSYRWSNPWAYSTSCRGGFHTTQILPFSATQKPIFVSYKYGISVGFPMQLYFFLSPRKLVSGDFCTCLVFPDPTLGATMSCSGGVLCCHTLSSAMLRSPSTLCSFFLYQLL